MPAAEAQVVNGHCDPAFEPVREAFRANFEEGSEIGAAVAVQVDGRTCVDLWAGLASRTEKTVWTRNTLVNVYSTTKGLASLCVQRLLDAGLLDLDSKVARYWPEFAAAGKGDRRGARGDRARCRRGQVCGGRGPGFSSHHCRGHRQP